jgi:hypothetical protein
MSQIESFLTTPMQSVYPSYLYAQYADDDDLQAFVQSFNAIAQGYLNWFLENPLGLYTSAGITGPLLDWTAAGVYGLYRPVLASQTTEESAGYDSSVYDTIPYNYLSYSASGSAQQTTDDIFKRIMTWVLYRGDGQMFSLQWLKNRIARFLHGANGSNAAVLNYQPSVTVSDGVFSITDFGSSNYTALQLCYDSGFLPLPFQYTPNWLTVNFTNNSGILTLSNALYYPKASTGLPPGSVWYNAGSINVVSGITPSPTAPALMFATTDPNLLLTLGGGNLPTTNPNVNGQLWNNAGVINIAT